MMSKMTDHMWNSRVYFIPQADHWMMLIISEIENNYQINRHFSKRSASKKMKIIFQINVSNLFARRTPARCHIQKNFCITKCSKPFFQADQVVIQATFFIITGNDWNLAGKAIRIANATQFTQSSVIFKWILQRKSYQIYFNGWMKKNKRNKYYKKCVSKFDTKQKNQQVERTEDS